MAATTGNVEVARALVAEHKADVNVRLRDANTVIGYEAGSSLVHACVPFATTGQEAMLELLLDSGIDLNAQSNSGL